MQKAVAMLQLALLALLSGDLAGGTPVGAPVAACVTMTPQHNAAAQADPPIYALSVERTGVDTFSVTLSGTIGVPFKGFLIQARATGSSVPLGTFEGVLGQGTQFRTCSAPADSVTHSDSEFKDSRTFTWRAPGSSLTGVRFVATTCLDFVTFWLNIVSADLGTL